MNFPLKLYATFFCLLILPCFLAAQGSALLVGGGSEDYNSWSDQPYGWFVKQADSGKVINIDVSATSAWYTAYFISLGASVESRGLQISTRTAADDSSIYRELISANGVFIEGGDQWDYIRIWKGTLVEQALEQIFRRGGVIGGTSAGLAVLGEVVFDAKYGSAYPDVIAYDPYNIRLHLTDDFLDILPGILTDSHFHSRGRLGRLVPMLARRITENKQDNLIGIGITEQTAFCLDASLVGKVYGNATVTILAKTENSEIICVPARPVTFTNLHLDQLIHGVTYDLKTLQVVDPGPYLSPVFPMVTENTTYTDTVLSGSDESTMKAGDIMINGVLSAELNAWYGRLTEAAGDSLLPGTVIMPRLWANSTYFENKWIGGMFGASRHPGMTAVYLDDGGEFSLHRDGTVQITPFAYILDTKNLTYTGFYDGFKSNYPALIGAKLHFLSAGDRYDLVNNSVISDIETPRQSSAGKYILHANYPNPFNPLTVFRYELDRKTQVRFTVWDMRGRLIQTLFEGIQHPGYHQVQWDASGLSSGIYFYSLQSGNRVKTRKCILLR